MKSLVWVAAMGGVAYGAVEAQAVVVTVTSGADAGLVVFDSGGLENDTANGDPSATLPAGSSWTGNPNSNFTVLTGATTGGPASAYEGDQYLRGDRTAATAVMNATFSRDLNPQQESFQIEFAMWMDNTTADALYPQAYFFIQDDAAGISSPGYSTTLAAFGLRYDGEGDPELMKYRISGSSPNYGISTTSVPAPPSWTAGAWNTVRFEWDHVAAKGWLTVNGQPELDVTLAFSNGTFPTSYAVPTSVGQFQLRANNADTIFFVDSVPEPSAAALLCTGLVLVLRRRAAVA